MGAKTPQFLLYVVIMLTTRCSGMTRDIRGSQGFVIMVGVHCKVTMQFKGVVRMQVQIGSGTG